MGHGREDAGQRENRDRPGSVSVRMKGPDHPKQRSTLTPETRAQGFFQSPSRGQRGRRAEVGAGRAASLPGLEEEGASQSQADPHLAKRCECSILKSLLLV